MRGSYQYAPLKLILTRLDTDAERQQQVFLSGEYIVYQHAHVELPYGLPRGSYVLLIKADWSPLNQVRRLVTNIYA